MTEDKTFIDDLGKLFMKHKIFPVKSMEFFKHGIEGYLRASFFIASSTADGVNALWSKVSEISAPVVEKIEQEPKEIEEYVETTVIRFEGATSCEPIGVMHEEEKGSE